jgi:hypothetical protein
MTEKTQPPAAPAAGKELAADLERIAVEEAPPVVPDESKLIEIHVPGEGDFAVVVNKVGNVALKATRAINGTGIQPGDTFGETPERAVRIVLAGGATAFIDGGVRRLGAGSQAGKTEKGVSPAGEQPASGK